MTERQAFYLAQQKGRDKSIDRSKLVQQIKFIQGIGIGFDLILLSHLICESSKGFQAALDAGDSPKLKRMKADFEQARLN